MLDERHKNLIADGGKLFSNRLALDSFWQEISLNFYPEMAEFTDKRSIGEEFADHLSDSYPLIARRTLGDSMAALLRPVSLDTNTPGVWFSMTTDDPEREDHDAKAWLESRTMWMRKAMYARPARFVRAAKEGDHSFVTFGQAPLSVEMNKNRDGLLYRCWHLRDVAWKEDGDGGVGPVFRKWTPTANDLADTFAKDKLAPQVHTMLKDNPFGTVPCMHIVIDAEKYERRDPSGKKWNTKYVSIWIDTEHQHVIEEVGSHGKIYVIPRWVTVPGSQYASSPAVTAALPDARLIQAMTLTLLETGEKFADPPMVATQEAVRSDVNLFAGGVTWVDSAYDERLGDALRPVYAPNAGQGNAAGLGMRQDIRGMIDKAFFLDSLQLPPASVGEMTAFEVGQRLSEWIRRAMPIFEPMEFEYNGGICEESFDLMMRNGGFGPLDQIPHSLSNRELQFRFESPLHESADQRKGQKFLEAKAALVEAAELDPGAAGILDARAALRDVLGATTPIKWVRDEKTVEAMDRQRQEQQAEAQASAQAQEGAQAARDLGGAVKDFASADAMSPSPLT